MIILGKDDLYQVKFASLIADYDRRTLIDLYMPIVGYSAISIYFALWSEADKEKLSLYQSHEHLLNKMQMAVGSFVDERKKLEALGLLKTNIKQDGDVNYYTYQIFAPKTPGKFFSNTLLYGTLIKFCGESEANKLKAFYTNGRENIEGNDISATFATVFNPDLDNPVYRKALNIKEGEILGRTQSKVDAEFDFKLFIKSVSSYMQINLAVFTKPVLKEIQRLSTLYGVSEETAAECVTYCYNPEGPFEDRIDFRKLSEMFMDENKYPFLLRTNANEKAAYITSKTKLAKKINLMETISCKDFLQLMQNNTMPVMSDLKLVEDLSSKLGLTPAVINAIISYSLEKNKNVLSRPFVEKVAASVARENLFTAYDTMIFLKKKTIYKKMKEKNIFKKEETAPIAKLEPKVIKEAVENDEDYDKEEWAKMIEEMGG